MESEPISTTPVAVPRIELPVDVNDLPSRLNSSTRQPVTPFSPLTHVLILTSILGPVALFPYLAVRRHLLSIHRKIGEVGAVSAVLQRDLKTALLEASIRREEHERLRALIDETRRDVEKVKTEENKRELARATVSERMRRDLEDLMVERQKTRCVVSMPENMHIIQVHFGTFLPLRT